MQIMQREANLEKASQRKKTAAVQRVDTSGDAGVPTKPGRRDRARQQPQQQTQAGPQAQSKPAFQHKPKTPQKDGGKTTWQKKDPKPRDNTAAGPSGVKTGGSPKTSLPGRSGLWSPHTGGKNSKERRLCKVERGKPW